MQAAREKGDKAPVTEGYNYKDKRDVLYRLLMPRLDEVLGNELAQTGDEDGLELFRELVRKLDPPTADVAFDMKAGIEGLGKHVCANFGQASRFLTMLDARVRDYSLETGLTFPPDSLASIMRRVADIDTADRMDEAGVDISNFAKVEEWIRKREGRLRARGGAGTSKGPDAMVYGVAAAKAAAAAAAPPQGATATVPASPTLDPWARGLADPWTGAAQQQPGAPAAAPQQPQVDPWSLDALGKGKGKGSGDRGPMQCYNCLGYDHPQFLCTSAQGGGHRRRRPYLRQLQGQRP